MGEPIRLDVVPPCESAWSRARLAAAIREISRLRWGSVPPLPQDPPAPDVLAAPPTERMPYAPDPLGKPADHEHPAPPEQAVVLREINAYLMNTIDLVA